MKLGFLPKLGGEGSEGILEAQPVIMSVLHVYKGQKWTKTTILSDNMGIGVRGASAKTPSTTFLKPSLI